MILTEVEIEIFPVIKNKLFELKVQIPLWLKKNGLLYFNIGIRFL